MGDDQDMSNWKKDFFIQKKYNGAQHKIEQRTS